MCLYVQTKAFVLDSNVHDVEVWDLASLQA